MSNFSSFASRRSEFLRLDLAFSPSSSSKAKTKTKVIFDAKIRVAKFRIHPRQYLFCQSIPISEFWAHDE
jgi:hypothetical protein